MTTLVIKHPDSLATGSQMQPDQKQITFLQEVVGGHIKITSIRSDGVNRIAFVTNDCPEGLEKNIQFGDKDQWIYGSIAIVRFDGKAKMVPMSDEEQAAWIDFANEAATGDDQDKEEDEGEAATLPSAPPLSSVGISLVITPRTDESPEKTIDSVMAKEIGATYEHIPVTEKALYASALEVVREQGHEFEIIDQEQFLLNIKGRDGVHEKYLRLVNLVDDDLIASHQDLASLYGIDPVQDDWQKSLYKAIADSTECGAWCAMREGEVEVGFCVRSSSETDGFPISYPFSRDDWKSLLDEVDGFARGSRAPGALNPA